MKMGCPEALLPALAATEDREGARRDPPSTWPGPSGLGDACRRRAPPRPAAGGTSRRDPVSPGDAAIPQAREEPERERLKATLPGLPAPPELAKGAGLPLPDPPDRPPLPGSALRGAAGDRSRESGPLLPGDRGGGGAGRPVARPPSRPETAPPPPRAGPATERPPPPPRTHRPPEPARQAAAAETRRPAAPAGSGLERSAAQRSAAPRGRAGRAERELPAGGSGDRRTACLAAWTPLQSRPCGHRALPRETSVRGREALPGSPLCTGRSRPLDMPRAGTRVMLNV
ncbi:basic proline-rich protein-like [Equus quagga]|uniref:basic proline-rich protein-like n=1 Tax=Equus quagga TaxID=89248 RepID=UPI001EE35F33|nr:basic proline-rich protein-like [Equus quagga]